MYTAQNFDHLLGLSGFSERLLKNHFTLYQGYVANVNKLSDKLSSFVADDKTDTPCFAELTRRLGWEFNGMRLHEYYFDNLVKDRAPLDPGSSLAEKINDQFGSLANWEKEFRAAGVIRGIGWAILYYDAMADKLFNVWVNEHDSGHLAGGKPLLVMDVFEHAFLLDYGLKRAEYIEAFFKAINWPKVSARL
ncbi:MAG: superoxide dismutase [Candidatus Magasanikbacteria bacterium]|nr:superoxide dismutase [Candidatus Magasanikbacteria bacterium]